MPKSLSRIVLHTVFSTKYRLPLITPEIEAPLLKLMTYDLKRNDSHTLAINAVEDHVHILHTLPRTIAVRDLIMDCKKWSSRNIKQRIAAAHNFRWQQGYATFSVAYNELEGIRHYVLNQKQHHASSNPENSFCNELLWLLKTHGVKFDRRYLFEDPPSGLAA